MRSRTVAVAALLGIGAALGAVPGPSTVVGDPPATAAKSDDEVFAYFTTSTSPTLRIELQPAEYAKLEAEPREYVRARLREDDKTVYEDVAVHLKGFYGSWRTIDEKPGFSVRMDKYRKDQRFHGLAKFNLNNSVADATFFNEFIGSEVFRAAGMAATLAAHAHVWINERDVGVYVLKEGFDKHFLIRNFADPEGNLYDGGPATDIDTELEKDSGGKGPKKSSKPVGDLVEPDGEVRDDLHALLAAAQVEDPAKRVEALAKVLDMDRFLTFVALERMLCQFDGYCGNRNNYRLYFPKDGKGVFIPHGMDRLLGDPKVPLFDDPASIVARAVWDSAAWQVSYRARMKRLLPLFTQPEWLHKRIDAEFKRAKLVLAAAPSAPTAVAVKSRIAARAKNLGVQISQPAPKPLDLDPGDSFLVANWRPVAQTGGPKLAQATFGAERVLRIEAGPAGASVGAWKTRLLLPPGTYRFEASCQTTGVVPSDGPPKGGAGLLVPGTTEGARLEASGAYKPLAEEFTVVRPQKVDLAIELRATQGVANFRVTSLRIVRVR